jgi:hypothetical protein
MASKHSATRIAQWRSIRIILSRGSDRFVADKDGQQCWLEVSFVVELGQPLMASAFASVRAADSLPCTALWLYS